MKSLLDKELKSSDKILKPDCNLKSGRELLAFYLHSKFRQVLAYDSKCENPLFKNVNSNFVDRFSRRIIDSPSKRLLIGITGESASGKSTICREIKRTIEQFNLPVSVLSTDNYFNDISKKIEEYGGFDNLRDAGYDLDSPSNFQLEILKEDLIRLSQGIDIRAPMYLPNGTGVSVPNAQEILSQKLIVVEGIATMYDSVQDVFDIKIYVETDNKIRKERFISRACKERNQNEENAIKHWHYLIEAGEKYVKPFRAQADVILDGNVDLEYFSDVLKYFHAITNNFENTPMMV